MNTLRVVLVGLTAIAAIVALFFGQYLVTAVLGVGVVAHGGMWVWLARQRRAELDQLHSGVEALLREEV